MLNGKAILKRFSKAQAVRKQWDAILLDAYRFCLPNYSAQPATGTKSHGEKRGLEVFDGTGGEALEDRAAYTVGALFPAEEPWVGVQSDVSDQDQAFVAYAKNAFKLVQSAIDNSNFMAEIVPAMREAYISVGTIACDFGDVRSPLNFEALPIGQITPEESFDGVIRTNYREFMMRISDIKTKWPDIKALPQALAAKAVGDPSAMVKLVEAEIFDRTTRRTTYVVIVKGNGTEILRRDDDVGRTITFRVDKAPGETMGRGPVLSAMPDIKVLNKADELVLKNASIAVTGIWMADDDGVLNIANIKLKPGAIIPKAVGSNGLIPLQAPGRFDVSQLIVDDRRQRVRRKIFGQDLPPAKDAGKATAFEIGERVKMFETVEGPHLRRLIPELFLRIVRRVVYILMHPAMAGSAYYIAPPANQDPHAVLDALMDVLESPDEAMKRKRAEARTDQAVGMAVQSLGQAVGDVLDIKEYFRRRLKSEGVDADLIIDAQTAQKEAAQQQAQQQAMQLAAKAGGTSGGTSGGAGQQDPVAAITQAVTQAQQPHMQVLQGGAGS